MAGLQNQLTVDGSDPGWKSVVPMHPLIGTLTPQLMPPIRIVQSFEPVSINTVEQGEFEAGCSNGFGGGRFIRCPNCTGPAGKGVGGNLLSAVFYQSCSNELTHLTAAEAYPSPCGFAHVTIEMVEPSVLSGWESRYKGPVVCSAVPRNNTQTLTVVDFGAVPSHQQSPCEFCARTALCSFESTRLSLWRCNLQDKTWLVRTAAPCT